MTGAYVILSFPWKSVLESIGGGNPEGWKLEGFKIIPVVLKYISSSKSNLVEGKELLIGNY